MRSFRSFTDDPALQELDEIAIKPQTARIFAFSLLSRALSHRQAVKNESDPAAKLDALADLVADVAYVALLQIATDQNDPSILRKLPRR